MVLLKIEWQCKKMLCKYIPIIFFIFRLDVFHLAMTIKNEFYARLDLSFHGKHLNVSKNAMLSAATCNFYGKVEELSYIVPHDKQKHYTT